MSQRGTITRRGLLTHCTALTLVAALGLVQTPAVAQGQALAATGPTQRGTTILVVGDSLSAEYGLKRGSGWVALLEQRLASEKIAATVVNASISGDTTSGGRSRLGPLLAQHKPTHVIIELGGNDALRGLQLSMTQANLAAMAKASKAAGARVIIVGMQVPPNYGSKYGNDFASLFATVAKDEGAALVPFLLKGVADAPQAEALFQPDRIHPREAAHPAMLDNVWATLKGQLPR